MNAVEWAVAIVLALYIAGGIIFTAKCVVEDYHNSYFQHDNIGFQWLTFGYFLLGITWIYWVLEHYLIHRSK